MDEAMDGAASSQKGSQDSPTSRALGALESMHPDAEWDAGDMGCGELVLELRLRLKLMRPGQILKLTARDPGAREDLPAWCRLTGHRFVWAAHPVYYIGRKED
jgi:tRNA 2-thiouridine synthesizing protein A